MIKELRKHLASLSTERKALRNFALFFGVVFLALSAYMYWSSSIKWGIPAAAGFLMFSAAFIFPMSLKVFYYAWMALSFILGWVMTRLVLALAFFLVITPFGAVLRLLGKDLLDIRFDRTTESYWKKHEPLDDINRYKRQY